MKLLVDECLSTELTKRARQRGHHDASHVTWIGKGGWKDWQLKKVILDGDWTFVTRNSIDFRGPTDAPGSRGQYTDVAIHAGLICLNGPPGMDLDLQFELFEVALDELDRDDDLLNQVLEVNLEDPDGEIEMWKGPPKVAAHRGSCNLWLHDSQCHIATWECSVICVTFTGWHSETGYGESTTAGTAGCGKAFCRQPETQPREANADRAGH